MGKSKFQYWLEYVPVWTMLTLTKPLPIGMRGTLVGNILSKLVMLMPSVKRRAESNLLIAFPDMPEGERRRITARTAFHFGKTLTEEFNFDDFASSPPEMRSTGPGLDILRETLEAGKGAVIVTAHLGQWESLRAEVRKLGQNVGAVYKPNRNPFYEKRFYRSIIKEGGRLYAKGTPEVKEMIQAAAEGGVIVVLSDQRFLQGELIPFFGRNALTSTAPAGIAMKLEVPVIPVFCPRHDWGLEAQFEAPLKPGDPAKMMAEFHSLLEDRIRQYPEQWYWFHNRWSDVPKEKQLPAQ